MNWLMNTNTLLDDDCQVKKLINYKINPRFLKDLGFKAEVLNELDIETLNRCGVYFISFEGTDKFYVGSTTRDFGVRRKEHFNELCTQRHKNPVLTHAFNKYGGKMYFEVAEDFDCISSVELRSIEQSYLDKYMRREEIYNMNPKANGGGIPRLTDEQIFDIFALRSKGFSTKNISEIYGFCQMTISSIIDRKSYAWVSIPKRYIILIDDLPMFQGGHKHSLKFKCIKLRSEGQSYEYIQSKLSLPKNSVKSMMVTFKPRNKRELEIFSLAKDIDARLKKSISENELSEIKAMMAASVPIEKIAKKFGYSVGGIYNKLNEKRQAKLKAARKRGKSL